MHGANGGLTTNRIKTIKSQAEQTGVSDQRKENLSQEIGQDRPSPENTFSMHHSNEVKER
jgi:hypothetical protein